MTQPASESRKFNDRILSVIMVVATSGLVAVGTWIASSIQEFGRTMARVDERIKSVENKLDKGDALMNQVIRDVETLKEWRRNQEIQQQGRAMR